MNKLFSLFHSGGFFFLILVLTACKSMGPRTIPVDSFNYNDRIAQHRQEQMLLNIVRIRYGEAPLFMNVNLVINQYSRTGNAGVGTNIIPGSNSQSGDISGSWSDRPTITYTIVRWPERLFPKTCLRPYHHRRCSSWCNPDGPSNVLGLTCETAIKP